MSKNNVYEFKISLSKSIYRTVAVRGNNSLYSFAETIVKLFDFDFDHAFGFYSNLKDNHKSDEIYELFADDGDNECSESAKGVSDVHISEVFVEKKKMLFLFDYGDNWEFTVECQKITEPTPKIKYPKILEKEGKPPEQYG